MSSSGKYWRMAAALTLPLVLCSCRFGSVLMASTSFTGPASNNVVGNWEAAYAPIPFTTYRQADITVLVVGSCAVRMKSVTTQIPAGPGELPDVAYVNNPVGVRLLIDGQEIVRTSTIWNGTILAYAQDLPAGDHNASVEWKADAQGAIQCENATASIWQTTRDKFEIRKQDVP